MIGPVFLFYWNQYYKRFRAALVFDLGVILGDVVFIGIAYLGSFRLIQSSKR
jgi:threonine/homoserine/homoserine lactone efflux protein